MGHDVSACPKIDQVDDPAWRPSSFSGRNVAVVGGGGGRRIVIVVVVVVVVIVIDVVVVVVEVGQVLHAPDVPPWRAVLRERTDGELLRADVGEGGRADAGGTGSMAVRRGRGKGVGRGGRG